MPILQRIILASVIGLSLLGLILFVLITPERVADSLMNPGAGSLPDGAPPPDDFGLPPEPFAVITSDNVRIDAWFIPASAEARGSVVVCHGVGSNRWGAIGLAQTLHQAGDLDVTLFDFRGHGLSERVHYTYGAHEVRDLAAVVEWVRERTMARPVSVVGWSAGASTTLLYAAGDSELERIVVINPFAEMAEMAAYRRPFFVRESVYAEALELVEQRANFRMEDVSPLRAAPQIAAPVLMIIGEADTTVPPSHGRRIHGALADSTLWPMPAIGHDDWWTNPDFGPRLVAFFHPGSIAAPVHGAASQ